MVMLQFTCSCYRERTDIKKCTNKYTFISRNRKKGEEEKYCFKCIFSSLWFKTSYIKLYIKLQLMFSASPDYSLPDSKHLSQP